MEHYEALVVERENNRLKCSPHAPREGSKAAVRRCWAAGVLAVLSLATGCVSLGSLVPGEEAPPTGDVCQVVAVWDNQVVFTPDPVHNGDPTPGIAGRMYLFGPRLGYPLAGDGSLVVSLFLDPPGATTPLAGVPPVEEWRIDKDTLHRLLRKDAIGWGYTLFLPWGSYKKEIRQVRLRIRYQPANSSPLYAETPKLTFSDDNTLPEGLSPQAKLPQRPTAPAALVHGGQPQGR